MATEHTAPVRDFASIRDTWIKVHPGAQLFDDFGPSEIEAYWRTTLCLIGLRLRAVRKVLSVGSNNSVQALHHMERLDKEFELCRAIGDVFFSERSSGA
jgi:hypothetical protein